MTRDLVYLVTGGSGFIGEHIVQLLKTTDYVKEVKIFDLNEGDVMKHSSAGTPTITFIKGDITNYSQMLEAFKGVHVVIHTAALVDFLDEHPFKKLEAINVGGTENVVKACLACSVPYLLYTSSIAAVGPNTNLDPMKRITEDTVYPGEPLLSYGKTKACAEKLVLSANGQQTSNGGKLITCVLRPSTIYGEKSQHLVDTFRSAKSQNNKINYIEMEDAEQSLTYVGNVAWMHVAAARQMQLKPELLGGQAYYSYDDTPFKHRLKLIHDLFNEIDSNIKIGAHIPYWKMWLIVSLFSLIRFILKPFRNLKPFLTLPILNLVNTSFCPETDKATRHFGYRPFYSWVESKHRTCQWLKRETEGL